jgi:Fe2+ transport system protein FeoA
MMSLTELGRGHVARVEEVRGNDSLSQRLLEMGLTPGCEVEYLATAPLGDPLEFKVRGYRLSLRKREAERVQVTLVESPSAAAT